MDSTTSLFDPFKPFYAKLTPCFLNDDSNESKQRHIQALCSYIEGLSDEHLVCIKGTLLVLVSNAPKKFERLRSSMIKRKIQIEETKISAFIEFKMKVLDDEEDQEIVEDVFQELFKYRFRVPNLYKIFSWHPSYLESMSKLMNTFLPILVFFP